MSEREILRAAFKTAYLNKEHRFQPDMRRYGELGEYKDSALESEFETFCDGVTYGLAAQRDEGLAREAVMQNQLGELWQEISALRQSIESASNEHDAIQRHLAEAEKHLGLMVEEAETSRVEVNDAWAYAGSTGAGQQPSGEWLAAKAFLASPGCADGEKS